MTCTSFVLLSSSILSAVLEDANTIPTLSTHLFPSVTPPHTSNAFHLLLHTVYPVQLQCALQVKTMRQLQFRSMSSI